MAKLITLLERVSRAETELQVTIAERFTPGLTVHRDDSNSPLTVLDVAWKRVKVRNDRTNREYWLYATRLSEFSKL